MGRKTSNIEELYSAYLLIEYYTEDEELREKLKMFAEMKQQQCSDSGFHFYATSIKNYLLNLNKVEDKFGAVDLSISYNTYKVMTPKSNKYGSFNDTAKGTNKRAEVANLSDREF